MEMCKDCKDCTGFLKQYKPFTGRTFPASIISSLESPPQPYYSWNKHEMTIRFNIFPFQSASGVIGDCVIQPPTCDKYKYKLIRTFVCT